MEFNDMAALALENSMKEEIALYRQMPEHKFSRRFERKTKKLFKTADSRSYFEWHGKRIPFRKTVVIAVLAVFLAALLVGAGVAVKSFWNTYFVEDYGLYSMLDVFSEAAPETLEEHYEIGIGLSGYTENILCDDDKEFWVEYKAEDNSNFSFSQFTKSSYNNVFLNTENAIVPLTEIEVRKNKGIYFVTQSNTSVLIWENENYVFEIDSYGFSKDELIEIANSVQKIEK